MIASHTSLTKAVIVVLLLAGAYFIMPLLAFGIWMYLAQGYSAKIAALMFIISSTILCFTWAHLCLSGILWQLDTKHPEEDPTLSVEALAALRRHQARRRYKNGLGLSVVTILLGALALIFTFAFPYHALKVTNVTTYWDNVYFSVITFTTTGFGDVHPVGFGRLIASVEALVGLLYQVFVIALAAAVMSRVSGLIFFSLPESSVKRRRLLDLRQFRLFRDRFRRDA